MVAPSRIRVMFSSRSNVPVFGTRRKLNSVRKELQDFVRGIRWWSSSAKALTGADEALFDVWIHEDETHAPANQSTYQLSLAEVARADVVIVLYTGEGGSAAPGDAFGICHAEMQAAMLRQPELVHVVELLPLSTSTKKLDVEFREYVNRTGVYRHQVHDEQQLQSVVAGILQTGIAKLAHRAARSTTRTVDRGAALDWRRLDLAQRQVQMRQAMPHALGVAPLGPDMLNACVADLGGVPVLVRLDAIPGPMTMAAARERVGQPFLRDYQLADALASNDAPGPVHLIACHRGVTEMQAGAMLGSPDTMVVATDFGVYAADPIHRTQLILLKNCADAGSIDNAVRLLREWLSATGEAQSLLVRAQARRRIVSAIQREFAQSKT